MSMGKAVFGFVVLTALAGEASAYLDPGTGSILLQGIVAGLAAVAVVARRYWQSIKRFLGFRVPKPPGDGSSANPSP